MNTTAIPESPSPSARSGWGWKAQQVFAIALAITCLWFAFRGVDRAQLLEVLKGASIGFIALSAALNLATSAVKCTKVGVLVRPVQKLRYRNLFTAEMVSVLIDTAFPFRLHEFVRAYLIGRSGRISASFIFGAEFVVKVVEALLLTAGLIVLSTLAAFPPWAATSIRFALAAAWAALAFMIVMVRWPSVGHVPLRLLQRVRIPGAARAGEMITNMLGGISRTAVSPVSLIVVLLITLLEWVLLAGALWAAARAVGVHLTALELLGVLAANHIAFAVPSSTSGSIGIYEVTGTMTLVVLFGMQREAALSLVLVAHFVMLAVGTLGGLVGLRMAHVTLRELRTKSRAAAVQDAPATSA